MNAAKIVVHKINGNGGDVILKLLGERISEARESPHAHSHGEILSFNVACGNVSRFGVSDDRRGLCSNAFRGTIAGLFFSIFPVNLHKHGVVDVRSEGIFDGSQINTVSISGQLNARSKAIGKVLHKFMGTSGATISNEPRNGKLGICINRNPRPDITESKLPLLAFGDVGGLGITERPNLVALNSLGIHIADMLVMIGGTRATDINKQFGDCVSRNTSQPRCRANGISFNEATNNFDSGVFS